MAASASSNVSVATRRRSPRDSATCQRQMNPVTSFWIFLGETGSHSSGWAEMIFNFGGSFSSLRIQLAAAKLAMPRSWCKIWDLRLVATSTKEITSLSIQKLAASIGSQLYKRVNDLFTVIGRHQRHISTHATDSLYLHHHVNVAFPPGCNSNSDLML